MERNEGKKIFNSTLRRRTPLKAKQSLKRSQFHRSKAPRDKAFYGHSAKSTPPTKKSRLKTISKKHKAALTKRYFPAQAAFLKLRENRFCWICIGRSIGATRKEIREIMAQEERASDHILVAAHATITRATEVHHYAGRIGRLLDFTPYFIAECRGCREWPHDHSREARALDLVAQPAEYNTFPREREEELWEEYEKNSSFQSKKDVD